MNAVTLLLVAPCSLLAGAVLQILVAKLVSARVKGILAFLFAIPAMIAVGLATRLVSAGQAIDATLGGWDGPLKLVLHADALSLLFALMGTGIGGLVLLYSIGYMAHEKAATRFFSTMLIFIAGFVGLVLSANLFNLYLCWELVGLCSFSLVGFWYTNPEAVAGARKVLLMTHIAGYGLLAAIIVIYARTGSALWTDPAVAQAFTGGVFCLMLVALVAKSVQFPIHTWIPEAMAAPTPVSALLHAACYVKAGVYLAARMYSFGHWRPEWNAALVWVGTITMAVGVMYAMVQTDLKRMLAFSTVSQIGYMMMGIGIGTPLAITAGLLHCLNHGFFKGGLFLTAGSVQHATGTRDMNRLGGLAAKMPWTTVSWLIGAGSMMGIPLMSGFASKWMLYAAALQAGWAAPAMVAWAVSLGTVFLGAKATSAVFLGPTTEATEHAHESAPTMVWGMGLLAAGSLVLGVAPQLAVNYLLNPILVALGMGAGVHVTWLGLSAEAGSFSTVGGLVLAVISLIVGAVIYAIAYVAKPTGQAAMAGAGGGIFTGGEPLESDVRLSAGDFSSIFAQNWKSFFAWTNVDRVYLGVWSGLQAISRWLGAVVGVLERKAAMYVAIFAVALFALIHFVGIGTPAEPGSFTGLTINHFLISTILIAAIALLLASFVAGKKGKIPLWPCILVVSLLCMGGLYFEDFPRLQLALLELAAFLTVVRVWLAAKTSFAKFAYLTVVSLSAVCAIASEFLSGTLATELFVTGIVIKLAAVPMLFWLLSLADEIPVLVLGLIISVVDITAYAEFFNKAQSAQIVLANQPLLLWIAALTSLLAALPMLTQKSLKRILVLSTIEDVGFLLLGVATHTVVGMVGAIFAAATHSIAKALLFATLAAPEADGALEGEPTALAIRYPVSAFGFLFGMLAMLGVPPLMGFLGRWRLYSAAFHAGACPLTIFILSSIFALIAYVLALTRVWWGPSEHKHDFPGTEPFVLKLVIVLLVAVLVAVGIWPDALTLLAGGSL